MNWQLLDLLSTYWIIIYTLYLATIEPFWFSCQNLYSCKFKVPIKDFLEITFCCGPDPIKVNKTFPLCRAKESSSLLPFPATPVQIPLPMQPLIFLLRKSGLPIILGRHTPSCLPGCSMCDDEDDAQQHSILTSFKLDYCWTQPWVNTWMCFPWVPSWVLSGELFWGLALSDLPFYKMRMTLLSLITLL